MFRIDGAISVLDNVDIGEDDQAFFDHLIHDGQKSAELFGSIDSGKHHGAVMR